MSSLSAPAAFAQDSAAVASPVAGVSSGQVCLDRGIEAKLAQAVADAQAMRLARKAELDPAEKAVSEKSASASAAQEASDAARAEILKALSAIQAADRQAHEEALKVRDAAKEKQEALSVSIAATQAELDKAEQALTRAIAEEQALNDGSAEIFRELERIQNALVEAHRAFLDAEARITENRDNIAKNAQQQQAIGAEIARIQGELEQAQAEAQDLSSLTRAQEDVRELQNVLAELQSVGGSAGLNQRITDLNEQIGRFEASIQEVQGRETAARENVRALEENKARHETQLNEWHTRLRQDREAIAQAEESVRTDQAALTQATQEVQEAETTLAAATQNAEEKTRRLEAQRSELQVQEGALTGARAQLEGIKRQLESAGDNRAQLEAQQAVFEFQVQTLTQNIERLRVDITASETENQEAQQKKTEATQLRDSVNGRKALAEQTLERSNQYLENLRQQALNNDAQGRQTIPQIEEQIRNIERELVAANEAVAPIQQEKATLESQLNTAREQRLRLQQIAGAFGGADGEQKAQERLAAAQATLELVQQRHELAQTTVAQKTEELKELNEQLDTLKAEQVQLNQMLEAATQDKERAEKSEDEQTKASAAKQAEIETAKATAERVHTEKEGERKALNDRLTDAQNRLLTEVVPALNDAERALQPLEKNVEASAALSVESIIAAPIADQRFAALEKQVAPLRARIAQTQVLRKELETVTQLRDRLRMDFAEAVKAEQEKEKALKDYRMLPSCDAPSASLKASDTPKAAPQAAEAPQNSKLAVTGVEPVSGVALLMGMLGAGAVVSTRSRKKH